MMRPDNGERRNPAERTAAFFSQGYQMIADQLQNPRLDSPRERMYLIVPTAERPTIVRVDEAVPFSRKKNTENKLYAPLLKMQPGQSWIMSDPRFRTSYWLISAWDDSEESNGACVQVKRASAYDPNTHSFESYKSQREMMEKLGLLPGSTENLEYRDDSNNLYYRRSDVIVGEHDHGEEDITVEDANRLFNELFGNIQ